MIDPENTIIVIPARMAAIGLAGKPLADVNGKPLVIHTLQQAKAANLGAVLVAASDHTLAEVVRKLGGDAIATSPNLASGFARAAEALRLRDPKQHFSHVLILPCDLPRIELLSLRRCLAGLINAQVEIATLAVPLSADNTAASTKLIAPLNGDREVAWIRELPAKDVNSDDLYAHLGVFALRRATLEKLASVENAQSLAEAASELGIRIAAVKVDTMPLRVDTPARLEQARREMKG